MNRGDSAFRRKDLMGTVIENSFSGALSFMRRKYTRELEGVDVAVTGIPFDQASSGKHAHRLNETVDNLFLKPGTGQEVEFADRIIG